jgi:FOG: TPR repeat
VALAPSNFEAHGSLGFACLYNSDFGRSLACYQKALELNPHGADLLADMADTLVHVGRTAEAVEKIAQAKELNPLHPDWYDWVLGIAPTTMAATRRPMRRSPGSAIRRTICGAIWRPPSSAWAGSRRRMPSRRRCSSASPAIASRPRR